jgi:hypothetical protein
MCQIHGAGNQQKLVLGKELPNCRTEWDSTSTTHVMNSCKNFATISHFIFLLFMNFIMKPCNFSINGQPWYASSCTEIHPFLKEANQTFHMPESVISNLLVSHLTVWHVNETCLHKEITQTNSLPLEEWNQLVTLLKAPSSPSSYWPRWYSTLLFVFPVLHLYPLPNPTHFTMKMEAPKSSVHNIGILLQCYMASEPRRMQLLKISKTAKCATFLVPLLSSFH